MVINEKLFFLIFTLVTGKTHKVRTLNDEDIAKELSSFNNEEYKQMVNK